MGWSLGGGEASNWKQKFEAIAASGLSCLGEFMVVGLVGVVWQVGVALACVVGGARLAWVVFRPLFIRFMLEKLFLCNRVGSQRLLLKVVLNFPNKIPTKYIFIYSTTVYVPLSELGLSHPLSRQRVCPSPGTKGGGAHSLAAKGVGESQFQRGDIHCGALYI